MTTSVLSAENSILRPLAINCSSVVEEVVDISAGCTLRATNQLQFVYGVVMPVVCALGLVGHLLTLLVVSGVVFRCSPARSSGSSCCGVHGDRILHSHLTRINRRRPWNNMYVLLLFLCIADVMVVIAWIPIILKDGLKAEIFHNLPWQRYFAHLGFPMINIFMATSGLLVVCLTLERCLSVCYPLRRYRIKKRHLVCAVTFCFLFPIAVYLPTIFGKHVVEQWDGTSNTTYYTVLKEPYKSSISYMQIYNMIKICTLTLLPLIMIVVMNAKTVAAFRRYARESCEMSLQAEATMNQPASGSEAEEWRVAHAKSVSQSATPTSPTPGGGVTSQREQQLTILLLCIIVIYIACMTPNAIFHLLHYSLSEDVMSTPGFGIFRGVMNVLGVANSAANFYVYCASSSHFRRQLRCAVIKCNANYDEDMRSIERSEFLSRRATNAAITTGLPVENNKILHTIHQ